MQSIKVIPARNVKEVMEMEGMVDLRD